LQHDREFHASACDAMLAHPPPRPVIGVPQDLGERIAWRQLLLAAGQGVAQQGSGVGEAPSSVVGVRQVRAGGEGNWYRDNIPIAEQLYIEYTTESEE
jgi:hypothetical protein